MTKPRRKTSRATVLAFIHVVRHSFHDAAIVYTYAGCYGLFQILREVFPGAEAYHDDEKNHVATMIDGELFDIYGPVRTKEDQGWQRLTRTDHEEWEANADGQRLEYILAKYAHRCGKEAEDRT